MGGGARLCRRVNHSAAILYSVDAFDSERSNRTGSRRNFDYYGDSRDPVVSHYGKCWDGSGLHARYRNPVTIDELWRFFSIVYISGVGYCNEHPNAPFRELTGNKSARRLVTRFGSHPGPQEAKITFGPRRT